MKKEKFSSGQLKLMLVAFHLLALMYAVLFLHPFYGSNDEFSLAAIASGAYGSYTWYFIYLHSAFAWLLRGLYALIPALNWYTITMYILIFLALTSVGFTWIQKNKKTGMLLSVMLILCSIQPLYVEMQYTKTAAIVTAAGYVLLFCRRGRSRLSGILFLLLGSWIRFQAFGMVSIMAFGFWLSKALAAWKEKKGKEFIVRDCIPCFAAFVLILGSIALENVLVYTPGSPEAHYKEYDRARQQLLDYGVPEWDEYQEDYESLGLTRTDCINLQNWLIADSERYTADTFKEIVKFRKDRPFQWEYLLDYLVILSMKPLFLMGLAVTLVWLWPFSGLKTRKNKLAVFWPYGALLGIYLYFIKIYRVLPIVVTACLLSFVIFVWSAEEEELAERWEERLEGRKFFGVASAGFVLTCVICARMLIVPVFQTAPQQQESSIAFRKLYDTISKDKDIYYAFDPFTNNGMELGYSVFEKLPDDYLTNIFALGGWETESPQVVSNLWNYEERNLLTSLYTSDRSVLISNTLLEHIMLHLQDIYDGIFITYSKLNEIGDFDLFALNYKMSGLKDSEETAVLDKAYTAENERYDVFEAAVNMTPEELEGKSVFLWMESRESGKKRMYQGVWLQQDESGLYSMLYDTELAETDRVRFMIPKLSYPLDDRYEVHVVIRDEKGYKLLTENNLYD